MSDRNVFSCDEELERKWWSGQTIRLQMHSGVHNRQVRVYLSTYSNKAGAEEIIVSSDFGASVVLTRDTPPNKFEIVRGNFPLDVAQCVVHLLSSLARSDRPMALDADHTGELK